MIEHSLKIFRGLVIERYKESDPPRTQFGALDKTNYIAPDDDKWRHNDRQSDNEEPKLKKKIGEKFGRKDSDSSDSDGDGDDEAGDGGDCRIGFRPERVVQKSFYPKQEAETNVSMQSQPYSL
ncbi:hypothetical protein Hanom_Chr04g00293901 [Helianthus anomalus]